MRYLLILHIKKGFGTIFRDIPKALLFILRREDSAPCVKDALICAAAVQLLVHRVHNGKLF